MRRFVGKLFFLNIPQRRNCQTSRGRAEIKENKEFGEKNGQYFGLKVQGDSMIEAGINEGDTVIIKRSDTADNGKIVVALIDEHEAMLKRIRRKGKTVALESANRNYETKIFGPDRVKVQGVLVSLYRNF